MHRHIRPAFANKIDQAGVGHDQRVGLERNDRRHVGQIGAHLGVVWQHVADHVELFAAAVRFVNRLAQRFQLAEFVVAHAQAVTRLTGINGVGAKGKSGTHHGV